jgi:hypothetical protein
MCFSTEASFTTALILGLTGYASLKNISSRSQFFLAAIPLLFAIQQLAEGFVWIQLNQQLEPNAFFVSAHYIFLAFAFLLWPIWIPLSLAMVEKIKWRRSLIYLNLACGIVLSLINLSYALKQHVSVQIVHHSLQYLGDVPSQTLLYPFIVLLPCFLSSMKNMWVFGILVALGYIVADYFYTMSFVSVWCFFAAIVSLAIYKIVKDNHPVPKKAKLS